MVSWVDVVRQIMRLATNETKRTLYKRFEGRLEGFQVAGLMEGSR